MLVMKNINKIVMFHVGLLVVLMAGAGYGYVKYWNVAVVNGIPISRLEYIKTMEKAGGKQTLDQVIQETLILSEGQKKGIKMDKAATDAEVAKVEERLKTQGQTLETALKASNMTQADLERQILMQKIETTLSATKTEITQAQLDEFIKTYKAQLPAKATKTELETIAREELTTQASKSAATNWVTELTKSAKVELK